VGTKPVKDRWPRMISKPVARPFVRNATGAAFNWTLV
jgi:hypothetical protein